MSNSVGRRFKFLFQEVVVDENSGCVDGYPKLGLASDHFQLNRFSDVGDNNYRLICGEVVRFVDDAPGRVASRWPCKDSPTTSASKYILMT